MEFHHVSVLLNEVIEGLNIKENGIYVDGTLGGAGHSLEIVKRLKDGKLIGIDQDLDALEKASKVLEPYQEKINLIHSNYENIQQVLDDINIPKVDGILLDLGVSSYQLDENTRGFSYNKDAPLDMRMDSTSEFSAWDVVNKYPKEELEGIIFKYGEERWAKRIAEFIVNEREIKPINSTLELVSVIKKAIPKKARMEGHHPAKKTFQAIRIEVNRELEVLECSIENMVNLLNSGGRLAIITFHSLEDRIVKDKYKELYKDCICPPDLPQCICDKKREIEIITRKPIVPSLDEIESNPRSRSAKLRIAEKL
ncbi:16S rRNA (cytosine(1402)-N(4))-methyltransferase RsmH [Paratissierella segnis]|jgi:16S rRNA (cytosine1402-N4)-methyltransferase|uniref:Ribosomal RNA small subunit methyltransferase H n=1 Tax=Paratissierella segnis TaxID=2763679 RepID=A0A926EYA3_9FIRM|nr:16S rRNA (cytosine(1402)-N(4))-methyltransferase RsmH [Paratissierella segnis]MBC8588504.1 16S rRNA (cytosine(1402)-N(4))-methyltransferase RsmH [Paratissierella segnis]